jgi:hypothetical protein
VGRLPCPTLPNGRYEALATPDLDRAIRLDPNNIFASRHRAVINTRMYDRAIQDFDQAIRLNPTSASELLVVHDQTLAAQQHKQTAIPEPAADRRQLAHAGAYGRIVRPIAP